MPIPGHDEAASPRGEHRRRSHRADRRRSARDRSTPPPRSRCRARATRNTCRNWSAAELPFRRRAGQPCRQQARAADWAKATALHLRRRSLHGSAACRFAGGMFAPLTKPAFATARWVFARVLGAIFFCAFASLGGQVRGLVGRARNRSGAGVSGRGLESTRRGGALAGADALLARCERQHARRRSASPGWRCPWS